MHSILNQRNQNKIYVSYEGLSSLCYDWAMRQPKLIILSGPLGIGKSTIAKKYIEDNPLALNLDIDEIRKFLGHWREHAVESAKLSEKMAEDMARTNLLAGHDVIIPQIYRREQQLVNLETIAQETNTKLYEVVLYVGKAEAVKRFMARGGFHKGGLVERGGGVKKLESMHDEMSELLLKRPNTIKIVPKLNDIGGTYAEFTSKLK